MNDNGTYKSVGSTVNTDYTIADPDILIVTPKPKTVDNPELARINVEFQANYASQLGSKCSVVVVMTNLLWDSVGGGQSSGPGYRQLFYGHFSAGGRNKNVQFGGKCCSLVTNH
jgi:hypothetical protein